MQCAVATDPTRQPDCPVCCSGVPGLGHRSFSILFLVDTVSFLVGQLFAPSPVNDSNASGLMPLVLETGEVVSFLRARFDFRG